VAARILLFALDDLRRLYAHLVPEGEDPRHDSAPFRAFRGRLLGAAADSASAPAVLTMWWEGTYNGYCLAVACEPPEALAALDPSEACPLEGERLAPPRADGYPLAEVGPGGAALARDREGAIFEAPFGAPAGHFGAPGMRRVT
jgi:hypothetical protein